MQHSYNHSFFIILAVGTPTTVQSFGTSSSTTAPAPIFAFAPIVMLPNIVAFAPMYTFSFIVGALPPFHLLLLRAV